MSVILLRLQVTRIETQKDLAHNNNDVDRLETLERAQLKARFVLAKKEQDWDNAADLAKRFADALQSAAKQLKDRLAHAKEANDGEAVQDLACQVAEADFQAALAGMCIRSHADVNIIAN